VTARVAPSSDGRATLISVKVVPGASRSRIAGPHGDALKVQVAAPPERGRANDAVCDLFAEALGVPRRAVSVARGLTSPSKTIRVDGLTPDEVERRLAS
jgi:uncharacterized protein (TIGR00251 family)